MPEPVRLTPSLRPKVWGKKRLAPWFPDSDSDSDQKIGEAWYLCDRELPLLVKLLFTSERLSVQVHPDDGEDGPRGKTEMWHILDAEPGASIAIGFREPISRQRLLDSTRTGEVEALLNWMPVKPGETYFVKAHTVHAIGAGIVLCEIQQNSDVTYRLWDYGRPRELHHRSEPDPHRPDQGRHARRHGRIARRRPDDCGTIEAARLRHRSVRQEPSRRSG